MSGGGGGGNQTMTQSTKIELPDWYQGYAQKGVNLAGQLAQMPYQSYGGTRIAPFTGEQEQGLQMATQRAQQGSPVLDAARQNATKTLSGGYLDIGTNPAWAPMSQRIADAYKYGTAAQTDTAFSRANAFGDNSAYQQTVGQNQRAFGDALSQLAGNLYNQERGYQNQMTGQAPGLAQADYADAQALIGVGDARRQYLQDLSNMQQQDFAGAQNYGWSQLGQLAGLGNQFIGNQGTTTSTSPNPYQTSPLAGAIGGGLAGAALGSSLPALSIGTGALPMAIPGWGWAAGLGALAGGLMSR